MPIEGVTRTFNGDFFYYPHLSSRARARQQIYAKLSAFCTFRYNYLKINYLRV